MKKISLITILDNTNFGTYLQAIALGVVLQKKGCCVELVHYVRSFMSFKYLIKRRLKNTMNPLKWIKRLCIGIRQEYLRKNNWKFVKKHISLSKRYNSLNELANTPPIADIYLTGSDQVWNSIHNQGLDEVFYWTCISEKKHKAAYASSIGMNDIPEIEKDRMFQYLSSYNLISVRENKGKEILSSLGLKNVEVTLDPTLLLTRGEWANLINTSCFKKVEPYLLVYSVETKKEASLINSIASSVAKQKKLKIYGIYYGGRDCKMDCCDKNFYYSTPEMFVSLFLQADFVVVSSFHGTAFSINFNKQFFTVLPERFSSRIDSLLDKCGLMNHKISDIPTAFLDSDIDYQVVNDIMKEERIKSLAFIDKILKS